MRRIRRTLDRGLTGRKSNVLGFHSAQCVLLFAIRQPWRRRFRFSNPLQIYSTCLSVQVLKEISGKPYCLQRRSPWFDRPPSLRHRPALGAEATFNASEALRERLPPEESATFLQEDGDRSA